MEKFFLGYFGPFFRTLVLKRIQRHLTIKVRGFMVLKFADTASATRASVI